ncbi:hypothetical protein LG634_11145 [Streptomyces bambusae]|uniref:hypothetical protein n=1 Tax=Streptomyces bambusae TaxID=1550616 RepID=UPI001CFD337E|nr:hypothetical protein [Streptomyces bambusae]MCB5165384.1 hypothetical protein [Streptomyces bambusae]
MFGPPPQPLPVPVPTGPADRVLAAVAGVLWALTFGSVGLLAVFVLFVAVWGASAGEDVTVLLVVPPLVIAGAWVLLALVYRAPGIRRLSKPARFALLGALACPAPLTALFVLFGR